MKQLKISLLVFVSMSILFGLAYPLALTGLAQLLFPHKANGSLIVSKGRITGSAFLAQSFTGARYFHARPSAGNYDGNASGGSNFGPTNKKLVEQAAGRAAAVRKENSLPAGAGVPSDLALASGSGLDPHISLESALLQARRVARERNMTPQAVEGLIRKRAEARYFGGAGDRYLNVLLLNMELDSMGTVR